MNNKVALIFGAGGQDGYYLQSILRADGYKVVGASRSDGDWLKGDVADAAFVKNLILTHRPEFIFHLAANSTTAHSAIFENHSTISNGATYILEYVKQFSAHTKVFLSGSGLQFVNLGKPIKETDPLTWTSPYSVDRIYTLYAARYFRSIGIKVYFGYFFHHDSPLRGERHLNMKIIKTALAIKEGTQQFLEIGDPEVIKEFNHAHDLMKAVWCLVNQDAVFEAVIGSGRGHKIEEWIDICFGMIGVDKEKHLKINTSYRPEFASMVSDPATIISLGWKPAYDIHSLATDMIENG